LEYISNTDYKQIIFIIMRKLISKILLKIGKTF
jgi:hypothetical protein